MVAEEIEHPELFELTEVLFGGDRHDSSVGFVGVSEVNFLSKPIVFGGVDLLEGNLDTDVPHVGPADFAVEAPNGERGELQLGFAVDLFGSCLLELENVLRLEIHEGYGHLGSEVGDLGIE